MFSDAKAARPATEDSCDPGPLRRWYEEARSPFIVHGHRHACLYRPSIKTRNGFIVLKICKKLYGLQAYNFAYLWNNEAGGTT